jgi:CheY-like chemotaxis protein
MIEGLGQVKRAGERAAALTRQLLAFSRKQVLEPRLLDLNLVVKDVDKMLRRLIGEDIEFVTVLELNLKRVRADPGQIEQVLMNLAVNARDAMPQGGKLTIETQAVELDEDYAVRHVGIRPGTHVMLAVSDTGCGIDEDTKARIFEPFFTTKDQGKGTGLGLAVVYGIIKQSGGSIWVYSEPGHGTTFKIYLPCVSDSEKPLHQRLPESVVVGGAETILLVEDETAVRKLALTGLQAKGYNVFEAANGTEAMAICDSYSGQIDLLVTDIVMPLVSGRQVAEHLQSKYPDIRVLYMSGYTDEAVIRHGILDVGMSFLQKPFTPRSLARKVRQVLDHANRASAQVPEK